MTAAGRVRQRQRWETAVVSGWLAAVAVVVGGGVPYRPHILKKYTLPVQFHTIRKTLYFVDNKVGQFHTIRI